MPCRCAHGPTRSTCGGISRHDRRAAIDFPLFFRRGMQGNYSWPVLHFGAEVGSIQSCPPSQDERHFCSQPVLVYHSENSKCGSSGGHTGRSIEAGKHRDSAELPTDITFRLILDQNHQHLSALTWPSLAYDSISLSRVSMVRFNARAVAIMNRSTGSPGGESGRKDESTRIRGDNAARQMPPFRT